MGGLAPLVLRPLPMKPKYRDAPLVLDLRIDLAIGVLVGDHFAAAIELDERPVVAAHVLLELHPVAAAGQPLDPGSGSEPRHTLAAAEFDVVAASKAQLAGVLIAVQPPGNIHLVSVCGVFVERRQTLEQWNLSGHAAANRIHKISPESAARVGEPIWRLRAPGIEQNSHRFAGTRRQDHHPCGGALLLP